VHRTVVAGGPRVGKTTLAEALAREVGCVPRSTDELVGTVSFQAAGEQVASWLSPLGPWVIEGCAVVRALRYWLAEHQADDLLPCERIFWSTQAKAAQSPGQLRMAKGIETVWGQIESRLTTRGVLVLRY
jgi:hypothetical protein